MQAGEFAPEASEFVHGFLVFEVLGESGLLSSKKALTNGHGRGYFARL